MLLGFCVVGHFVAEDAKQLTGAAIRDPKDTYRQSEKAPANGDTQQGESTHHVLAAIPSSSPFAAPANYYGLCRWLKA
jgi:hypothetical protein